MSEATRPERRLPPKRAEGQWALGYREPLNRAERAKRDQDPLDPAVAERIARRYPALGHRSIDPVDLRSRLRWYGIYTQRPEEDGFLMMRIRIPGGILDAAQVETIGRVSQDFGRNVADVTDRQNVQLHWIRIEDVPEIWERLGAVGMTSQQTCGDTTRNVLGCPLAGIDATEHIDASQLVYAVNDRLTGNLEFSNLPRKYKISIAGCRHWCHCPEINDIGVVASYKDGRVGFDVMVGGGLSTRPMLAKSLGAFVPPEDLVEVCAGITAIFRDYGYRRSREKARLKFLVADWGPEKFRDVLESEYLKRGLEDAGVTPRGTERLHLGPNRQRDGLFSVGGAPEAGRVSGDQLVGLAHLARRYGRSRLRTTLQQKVVILDVPADRVRDLVTEMDALGITPRPSVFRANTIACTGLEFCKLAITETKHRARWLVGELERRLPGAAEEIRINVNGCPNSCARFQVGDIGLMGVLAKGAGDGRVEAFQVHLGGHLANDESAFARKVRALRVPADALPDYVARLVERYRARRNEAETFSHFTNRLSDDELYEFALSAADERVFEDATEGLIESGVPQFEPQAQIDD